MDGSLQGQVTRRVTNDDDAGSLRSRPTSNATFPLPRTGRSFRRIHCPSDNDFTGALHRLHHPPTTCQPENVRPFWGFGLLDLVPGTCLRRPQCESSPRRPAFSSISITSPQSVLCSMIVFGTVQTVLFLLPPVFQMLLRIPSHLNVAPTRQII